jgi:hypothetical protein
MLNVASPTSAAIPLTNQPAADAGAWRSGAVGSEGSTVRNTVSTSWMGSYCVFAEKKLVVIANPGGRWRPFVGRAHQLGVAKGPKSDTFFQN